MSGTNLTLLNIEKNSSLYTVADQKFLNFMRLETTFVINNSIVAVAEKAGISEATITRFSRKAGFKGFNELKLMLSQGQIREKAEISQDLDIFSTLAQNYNLLIQNTLALIDEKKIDILIKKLQGASRVKFYGLGSSGNVANEIVFRIIKLDIPAFAYTEGHYMKTDGALSRPGEVVVALSLAGVSSDVCDALSTAQENGAFGVVVTNFQDTLMAQAADLTLTIPTKDHLGMGQIISPQIGILFLFDCIMARIISEDLEKYYSLRAKVIHTVFRSNEQR